MLRNLRLFAALALVFIGVTAAQGATIYTGPKITFTKPALVSSSDPASQDRITENVWLTRDNTQGIFNIVQEPAYDMSTNTAPADTEWAYGTTAELESLTFTSWFDWHGRAPEATIGQDAVLHLISDDIYIDIKFLEWGGFGDGGVFSYERSTPGVVPEPSSIGLVVVGLAAAATLRRRLRTS